MSNIDRCWKCGRVDRSCLCFSPSNQKSYTVDEMDLLYGYKKQVDNLKKELEQVKKERDDFRSELGRLQDWASDLPIDIREIM